MIAVVRIHSVLLAFYGIQKRRNFKRRDKGVARGCPRVPVTPPPFCKPVLTKQPKTGGENAMTISWP